MYYLDVIDSGSHCKSSTYTRIKWHHDKCICSRIKHCLPCNMYCIRWILTGGQSPLLWYCRFMFVWFFDSFQFHQISLYHRFHICVLLYIRFCYNYEKSKWDKSVLMCLKLLAIKVWLLVLARNFQFEENWLNKLCHWEVLPNIYMYSPASSAIL